MHLIAFQLHFLFSTKNIWFKEKANKPFKPLLQPTKYLSFISFSSDQSLTSSDVFVVTFGREAKLVFPRFPIILVFFDWSLWFRAFRLNRCGAGKTFLSYLCESCLAHLPYTFTFTGAVQSIELSVRKANTIIKPVNHTLISFYVLSSVCVVHFFTMKTRAGWRGDFGWWGKS